MASGEGLRKEMKELLAAFDNKDPPPNRQKAVTPGLLEDLVPIAKALGPLHEQTADLIVGGFFFAMRACEFCKTEREGRTKKLELRDITFRDKCKKVVPKSAPDMEERAHYVTVRFRFQKNNVKADRRTQGRSGRRLCPVKAWARVCQQVILTNKGVTKRTPVCEIGDGRGRTVMVTSARVTYLLRSTCNSGDYGMKPSDLGTRSIRSGAAMALFLMDHSVERIMILGRWSSDAFLVYLRPQVLEWTNIMARDMASNRDFRDLNHSRDRPSALRRSMTIPSFYSSH